jgi:hypothetical protein
VQRLDGNVQLTLRAKNASRLVLERSTDLAGGLAANPDQSFLQHGKRGCDIAELGLPLVFPDGIVESVTTQVLYQGARPSIRGERW